MTTTTIEKMLQRAAELERKAAALRLAAEEMTGHHTEVKQTRFLGELESAMQLRAKQTGSNGNGNGNGNGHHPPLEEPTIADRERLILEFMTAADRPQRVPAVRQHLAAHGIELGDNGVRYTMQKMPQLRLDEGRWHLAGRFGGGKAPAATPTGNGSEKYQRDMHPDTQARRAAKSEAILRVLREHGKPMKTRDLTEAARAAGVDSLTGIYGLVRKGLVVTRGSAKSPRRTYALAAATT